MYRLLFITAFLFGSTSLVSAGVLVAEPELTEAVSADFIPMEMPVDRHFGLSEDNSISTSPWNDSSSTVKVMFRELAVECFDTAPSRIGHPLYRITLWRFGIRKFKPV